MIGQSAPGESEIMVVDDHPSNVQLLKEVLERQGYRIRTFLRGLPALEAAADCPPDLVLLDINMPEMNGYEVCTRLKADSRLSKIPVIFLSALDDTEDKVKAFRCGAVDYISKPLQLDEVRARVDTHLKIHRLQRQLQLHNSELEKLVEERTRELAQAHARLKMLDRSKNDFLNLISHEFRTPLNGVLGVGEIVLNELCSTPETIELRDLFEESRRRILSILDHALLLTQIEIDGEKFRPAPICLSTSLKCAIAGAAELANASNVGIAPAPPDLGFVLGQEELVEKALQALIETAVRLANSGEMIGLGWHGSDEFVRLRLECPSATIPQALIPTFFDLFTISEANMRGVDLGLRPAVACRILSLFGGAVSIENRAPRGTHLTISLTRGGAGFTL